MSEVDDWRAALDAAGELQPAIVTAILSAHGDRGGKAIDAVAEQRVKRYRDFTVVVGYNTKEWSEEGGRSGKDRQYDLDDDAQWWQEQAGGIAERVDAIDHHERWYSDVREFK